MQGPNEQPVFRLPILVIPVSMCHVTSDLRVKSNHPIFVYNENHIFQRLPICDVDVKRLVHREVVSGLTAIFDVKNW